MSKWLAGALITTACVSSVVAQSPAGAAPVIAESELARSLETLTADSLQGPASNPGLDRTVRYLIGEWHALGLQPGLPGQRDTAWVQRYPLPGQLSVDYATAGLAFASTPHGDTAAAVGERGYTPWHPRETVTFATGARFLSPVMPAPLTRFESPYKPAVLIAGPHTVVSAGAVDVANQVVLYVPPAGADSATMQAILQVLVEHSAGVVVLSSADSMRFAAQVQAGIARPAVFVDKYSPRAEDRSWLAELRIETIGATLALNGVDTAEIEATHAPVVRPLPFLQVCLRRELPKDQVDRGVTAPNVIATLPGRDTALQGQWIVITASMDLVGPDGASNALGVAGLLALARAFAAPAARPRRSLLFVATSGSGMDFAGSRAFVTWMQTQMRQRQAGGAIVVALDLIGRASRDSVAVDGLRELVFAPATSPAMVAMLHSELGLSLVDTGSVLTEAADREVFSSHWIPTLGVRTAGSPVPPGEGVIADARLIRLVYYIVSALANAEPAELPAWNAAAKTVLLARPTP